jgi:hypothetical protein
MQGIPEMYIGSRVTKNILGELEDASANTLWTGSK